MTPGSRRDRGGDEAEVRRLVTKEQARQHHRVRGDSKSGVKGVRYNPESDTGSAYVYREGHCYHVGTYRSQERAVAAYETELRKENPDLHRAPEKVERPGGPAPVPRGKPETARKSESR
jgi:hypothetical protein